MAKRKKEKKKTHQPSSSSYRITLPLEKRNEKRFEKEKRKRHLAKISSINLAWNEKRGKEKTCCCWWWSLDVEYQNAIIALYRPMDRQPFESTVFLRLGGPQEILFGSCKMKSAYVEVWKGNSKTYQSWLHSMPLSSFYPTTFCFSFPNTIKNWRGGTSGAI